MVDQDKNAPAPVEALKKEFQAHLQSVEFGSPDYRAFCDFYALEDAKYTRSIEMRNLIEASDPKMRIQAESELRITETKIALIDYGIDQAKITDLDYIKAFDRVEKTMSEIRSAVYQGLKDEYEMPDEADLLQRVIDEDFHDILLDDFMNIIYGFYH